jgi:ABC-type Na+ transport system ATPase subunit NatA
MTPTTAVHATGLVKTFDGFRAVDGIDLEVCQGEIFGVLGPNGAGKTTTLKMLATLLPIDAGQAYVFGVDVAREPHRIRQLLGVTGQYASVDEDLTATENLWLFGRLQGLRSGEARATAKRLLEQFSLQEAAHKPIAQFSGGMRRRLDLAASLITRPPLIFLDEPTTGLDPRTRGQMWETIRGLVADGCTVLLTTHEQTQRDFHAGQSKSPSQTKKGPPARSLTASPMGPRDELPSAIYYEQLVAQVQASKPLCAALGPDTEPITLPLESVRSSASEAERLAEAPLTVPLVNAGLDRFGSDANPASVPISSGVSSIHSAVACVDV